MHLYKKSCFLQIVIFLIKLDGVDQRTIDTNEPNSINFIENIKNGIKVIDYEDAKLDFTFFGKKFFIDEDMYQSYHYVNPVGVYMKYNCNVRRSK